MRTARTPRERLVGLAFQPPIGEPLLIPRCRSVHTFGMRYALHLTWLDADGDTVRVDEHVPPRRLRTCWRATGVIERPAAAAGRTATPSAPCRDPAS